MLLHFSANSKFNGPTSTRNASESAHGFIRAQGGFVLSTMALAYTQHHGTYPFHRIPVWSDPITAKPLILCRHALEPNAVLHAMNATDLSRRLKQLRRAVVMLQTEFRSDHMDEGLLTEIDQQMDHGIATDPRCIALVALVDALRESTLTPRKEMFRDAARACEQLTDGIEQVVARL